MMLSRDTRKVIDTLLTYDEDLPNRFYSVRLLETKIQEPIRVMDVLDDLAEMGLLQWGDRQHTGFRLMERARAYKEIQRLENRERLTGFVSGVLLTVIAWILSEVVR